MKRVAAIVIAVLFVLTMIPVGAARAQEVTGLPADVEEVKVSSYGDGDTIKVNLDGERVMLNFIGADAPEPKECYGKESLAAMKKLLPKGTVLYLETDAVGTDAAGQLLRHVWTEGKGGKAYLVNAKLIRDGVAGWSDDGGNAKYANRYEKAQADAKRSENGLWTECTRLHSKERTKSQQRADAQAADEARAEEEARAAEENADSDGDGIPSEVENQPDDSAPVDDYFATGPATPAELEYFDQVQVLIGRAQGPIGDVADIANDPDFGDDVTLFFDLDDALRPFHGIYASFLQLSAPTARLEAFHQASLEAFSNYDQAATNFELFITTVDISYVYATTANLEAASAALDRATNELDIWQEQAL